MDSKSFQIFFLFSLSAWDHSSSRSLLSTAHPQPVISGGVTRSDRSLSSHRLSPTPNPSLNLLSLLWLLVRTNLSSSVDNRLLKPSSQTSRPTTSTCARLRQTTCRGAGWNPEAKKWPADPESRLQLPPNDFTFPSSLRLSCSFSLMPASSTLPLSPHSLLSLSAVTSRFYPDSSICLVPSTLIQGIVHPSTMTHTCEKNPSKITQKKTKLRNMFQ